MGLRNDFLQNVWGEERGHPVFIVPAALTHVGAKQVRKKSDFYAPNSYKKRTILRRAAGGPAECL